MLEEITHKKLIQTAHTALKKQIKSHLPIKRKCNVGFPGGNVDEKLFTSDTSSMWAVLKSPDKKRSDPRYWNAFGSFNPDVSSQTIAVEINMPASGTNKRLAAFFARDVKTGDVFLMHSGKVGGGRKGIGKKKFLVWSRKKLEEVAVDSGKPRSGIIIGRVDASNIVDRIWQFVQQVSDFKKEASNGSLETSKFKKKIEQYDRYSREFSGSKSGKYEGSFEYETFHGDIVEALYQERVKTLEKGEEIFNSQMIDLFVRKEGEMAEIYEIKTATDRKPLYTAIGQLLTHTKGGITPAKKILVVPDSDPLSEDIIITLDALNIITRMFKLEDHEGKPTILLL